MPNSISDPVEPLSAPVLTCPTCGAITKQHRAGKNPAGTARRECRHCGRTYTPAPKHKGYDLAVRRQALKMYVDGLNFRRIARHLGVNPQSIANWVNAAAANLPAPPLPKERKNEASVETLELDELFTFVSQKKNPLTS
jgi:transposase-like protein